MSVENINFDDLESEEVVTWAVGETHILRFDHVKASQNIPFTEPKSGFDMHTKGLILRTTEVDGKEARRFWRMIQKRAISRIRPEVESRAILKHAYKIHRPGEGPAHELEIVTLPEDYTFSASDLKPGPLS